MAETRLFALKLYWTVLEFVLQSVKLVQKLDFNKLILGHNIFSLLRCYFNDNILYLPKNRYFTHFNFEMKL